MATNLPMPVYGTPRRGEPFTSGSVSGFTLESLRSDDGEISSGPMLPMMPDRSRRRPSPSIMPGFSDPIFPYRQSFIASSRYQSDIRAESHRVIRSFTGAAHPSGTAPDKRRAPHPPSRSGTEDKLGGSGRYRRCA